MTKRRTPKTREHAITPLAVEAYRKGEHLPLKRALGLKPWQSSPLQLPDGPRPAWWDEADWKLQVELRAELEAACG
jgi:hypothetical protein